MRQFIFALAALIGFVSLPAKAAIFELPLNGCATIVGDISSPLDIHIFASWGPPTIIVPGAFTAYEAFVNVSTALGPATNAIVINFFLNCISCGAEHNISGIAHISDAARTIFLSGQATATEIFTQPPPIVTAVAAPLYEPPVVMTAITFRFAKAVPIGIAVKVFGLAVASCVTAYPFSP
jgi:hypothetical protein